MSSPATFSQNIQEQDAIPEIPFLLQRQGYWGSSEIFKHSVGRYRRFISKLWFLYISYYLFFFFLYYWLRFRKGNCPLQPSVRNSQILCKYRVQMHLDFNNGLSVSFSAFVPFHCYHQHHLYLIWWLTARRQCCLQSIWLWR